MPMLYLRCKTCDEEFAARMSMSRESFKRADIEGNIHTCNKGHIHFYLKKDYVFRE